MARVGTCVNNQPTEEALKRWEGVMSETQGGAKIVPDDVREHETESNTWETENINNLSGVIGQSVPVSVSRR